MPAMDRGLAQRRAFCALCATAVLIGAVAGCAKKEPPPTVPGYYTGPIRPKGEVAPGPMGAPKAGKPAGEAATGK
jgi:hypothetical protein